MEAEPENRIKNTYEQIHTDESNYGSYISLHP